jgi:integrase
MAKKGQTFYSVQEFCNNSNWSKATQKNYYYALLHYGRFLYPNEQDPQRVLDLLSDRVKKKFEPAKDISNYVAHLGGKPPKTIGLYLTTVRSFYGLNGHLFNKQELKRIVPKNGDAETRQGELTTDILRKMIGAADIRGRVLTMLLTSTACRIGELCAVKLSDVDMSTTPARIHLRKEYTKNGRARTVFLTDECKEQVRIWLTKERANFLRASYQRNEGLNDRFKNKNRLKPEDEPRLLGLTTHNARDIWYNTIGRVLPKDQLRPDVKTRVHPFPPHVVRKWWRITANKGFRDEDIAHLIMGHWSNSLDFVYARMGDDGLGKEFQKAQGVLSILSGEDMLELQADSQRQAERLADLSRQLREMQRQMEILQATKIIQ